MLKVRIIAVIIALILTALTVYLVPIVASYYMNFMGNLNEQERIWFSWAQAFIGFSIAAFGFWRWKKKRSSKE
ncbi:MAG: hypothetical protein EOO52_05230 [Gammaproteobacteria bacterium]|nr:MAG: hypothetical protein EOO52_05230 [Gammaproteobacteria bacterium]